MSADVADCIDGNLGAWSIDGYTTPVIVGNRNHVVDVRKMRKNLLLDSADGIVNGGGDALNSGGDAEDVLRTSLTIAAPETLEGVARERLLRFGSSGG